MHSTELGGSTEARGSSVDFDEAAERARQAGERRDWPEALHWWEIARTLSPDRPPAHAGAGNALREIGRLEEADSLLSAAAERFPGHAQIAISLAVVANARQDWPAAIKRWESVRRQFPNNPSCYLGSINALRGAARFDEAEALLPGAEAVLAAADSKRADRMTCLWLALNVAKMRLDWPAVRQRAEEIIARSPNPSANSFVELARACWNLDQYELAERAAQRAVGIDPKLTEATIILAWAATEQGDGEKAIECYRRLAELNPGTVRWSLKLVELLNWLGHVEEAVRELDVVCRRWPDDPLVQAFLKNFGPGAALTRDPTALPPGRNDEPFGTGTDVFELLAQSAPPEAQWKRPLIVASPELEMQVVEVAGATAAVLVFTGAGDGVSMPLSIFDRYLAALDVTAFYLKDFSRLLFLTGIRSLGEDYASTLRALRDRLDSLGITRLASIGNCDGGAAAVRYGIELGADLIVAASPTTHVPEGHLPKLAQARNFKRIRISKNVAQEMTDLKPFLESRAHGATIEILYKEEDEWESSHALRIAGAPGVTLRAQRGHPHHAALHRLALSPNNVHTVLHQWLTDRPRIAGD